MSSLNILNPSQHIRQLELGFVLERGGLELLDSGLHDLAVKLDDVLLRFGRPELQFGILLALALLLLFNLIQALRLFILYCDLALFCPELIL